jgi:hypothetical protein
MGPIQLGSHIIIYAHMITNVDMDANMKTHFGIILNTCGL